MLYIHTLHTACGVGKCMQGDDCLMLVEVYLNRQSFYVLPMIVGSKAVVEQVHLVTFITFCIKSVNDISM